MSEGRLGALELVRVRGRSMLPTLADGDVLLVRGGGRVHRARPGRLVVVDESFMDFAPDENRSLASCAREGLAVVRSLTKVWGLAGVRAGYLLGARDLVARLEAARQPWPVNSVAIAAIEVCADDRQTPARVAAEVAVQRARLMPALAGLDGVEVWPSDANFLLLRVREALAVIACLRNQGIAVRPAADFPGLGEDFIRIAVRGRADNERLAEAIATAVARC